MSNHVLLNNVEHFDLKIITKKSEEYGDNVGSALIFPTEFHRVQTEYPILFQKDNQTGELRSIALLGFEGDENLFLNDGKWNASYIPATLDKGPFLIGFQEQEQSGQITRSTVVHIDLDDKRVNKEHGEAVFLDHGGQTPFIERINTMLANIQDGMALSRSMFATLGKYDLIEPLSIDVSLTNREALTLSGFYTISQEKLMSLDNEIVVGLHRSGLLETIYMIKASLNNFNKLIELKNRQQV